MKKSVIFLLLIILAISVLLTFSSCEGAEEIPGCDLYVYSYDRLKYSDYTLVHSASGKFIDEVGDVESDPFLKKDCDYYGWNFEGIFTEPNGGGEMVVDKNWVLQKRYTDCRNTENDIILYAHHTPMKFTIPLNYDGGSTSVEFDFYSENVALPSVTPPERYEHMGWRLPGTETYPFETLPRNIIESFYNGAQLSLEAVYFGNIHKLSLDAGEGTLTEYTDTARYDSDYRLHVPTAPEGRLFIGWFYNGEKITDRNGDSLKKYMFTEGISVTARYGNMVNISISASADESFDEYTASILETEGVIKLIEAPEGKQFDRIDISSRDGSVSLSYDEIEDKTVSYGEDLGGVKLSCFSEEKGGRRFELENVTKDLTVKVYYTDSVTDLESISDALAVGVIPSLNYGEEFKLPIAYKGGYRFDGWKIAGTNTAITDADGNSLLAWVNTDRVVKIEPILVADSKAPAAIFDAASFLAMKDNPSGKYILLNDVTLTPADSLLWKPINFSGELNGCGFKITGLTLSSDSGNLGLFNTLSGTVRNLTLDSVSITSRSNTRVNVGAFCATLKGKLDQVNAYGSILTDNANVGGLCGSIQGGKVTASNNYASVTTITLEGGATAGGIAGYIDGGVITLSENFGEISAYAIVGGIVGHVSGPNTVTRSVNHANITAGSGYVGGCIGKATATDSDGTVILNNLENKGNIDAKGSRVGGVMGYCEFYTAMWTDATFVMDFHKFTNSGDIKGATYVGGCIGCAMSSTGKGAFSPKISIKLTDLINSGNVTAESTAGGCIGYGHNSDNVSKIIRSSSSGKITANHTLGGIAGYMNNFAITSCDNTGTVLEAKSYYISDSKYYVKLGGYAGQCTTISSCTNKADIVYNEKGCYIGGIAGVVTATVSSCTNEGNITAPNASSVGGIVGRISHDGVYSFSKLTNSGNITANESVGGILGSFYTYFTYNDSDEHTTSISNLTSSGNVYSYGGFAGGIFGKLEGDAYDHALRFPKFKLVVSFVECSGNVTSEKNYAVGALIGYVSTDCTGSMMDAYSFTGKLNGIDATAETLVGSKTNFYLVKD